METKTLALTLAYIGTDYHGFARQAGLATVQGQLEEALAVLFRREIETVCAGRTDTGVHARGQVVSFELTADELGDRSMSAIRNSLNALTPDPITIRLVEQKPEGFSARFSAVEREYRYRIVPSEIPSLFIEPYVWWIPDYHLAPHLMLEASGYLIGEHDFKSFCVSSSSVDRSTIREIKSINIFGMDHLGESCIIVQIIGNAFLHSMVRIIVGSLVEVGYRRRDPIWIAEVLTACDRRKAGPTAPAQGLTLWRVRY
ncbi:MAG: tRNA pseudouridine(38-40) synthase TruA [Coriobacteriales bacterium]|jgi:tRNA pseudouridine38-40 synthase|nr:tRNA pseudouridine(38-40) synthase TruA [Coriobacteriales bacterium]